MARGADALRWTGNHFVESDAWLFGYDQPWALALRDAVGAASTKRTAPNAALWWAIRSREIKLICLQRSAFSGALQNRAVMDTERSDDL